MLYTPLYMHTGRYIIPVVRLDEVVGTTGHKKRRNERSVSVLDRAQVSHVKIGRFCHGPAYHAHHHLHHDTRNGQALVSTRKIQVCSQHTGHVEREGQVSPPTSVSQQLFPRNDNYWLLRPPPPPRSILGKTGTRCRILPRFLLVCSVVSRVKPKPLPTCSVSAQHAGMEWMYITVEGLRHA